jgi:hypothetical protein
MYNNDVGKGAAQGCEAYEVLSRVALVRVPFYFINLLPTSLLYISILLGDTVGERERERAFLGTFITGGLGRRPRTDSASPYLRTA